MGCLHFAHSCACLLLLEPVPLPLRLLPLPETVPAGSSCERPAPAPAAGGLPALLPLLDFDWTLSRLSVRCAGGKSEPLDAPAPAAAAAADVCCRRLFAAARVEDGPDVASGCWRLPAPELVVLSLSADLLRREPLPLPLPLALAISADPAGAAAAERPPLRLSATSWLSGCVSLPPDDDALLSSRDRLFPLDGP